jgi:hypothetical protein
MNDANEKDAARVKAIRDQEASDAWRGKLHTSFAQDTKDWGAKTDQATADKMHSDTMAWAGNIEGNRNGGIDSQEQSDEWRGKGKKIAWEHAA